MQEIKIDDKLLNTSIFGIPDEEDSKKKNVQKNIRE